MVLVNLILLRLLIVCLIYLFRGSCKNPEKHAINAIISSTSDCCTLFSVRWFNSVREYRLCLPGVLTGLSIFNRSYRLNVAFDTPRYEAASQIRNIISNFALFIYICELPMQILLEFKMNKIFQEIPSVPYPR
ncbi:MAG: hypothetical protein ACTSYI_15235 [Promethearchaeota archaeon]